MAGSDRSRSFRIPVRLICSDVTAAERAGEAATIGARADCAAGRNADEDGSRAAIYDQLAGGFHRYSVDEHWVVPHFEKMAYDNSELLKNYVHAFQTFGDPRVCARVATGHHALDG